MRGRLPLVPLVLTVVCAAGIVTAATAASGAPAPVPVAQQGGHWVVNRATSAALHVHGGTAEVDARVDLPPDAVRNGLSAVAGGSEGFVVGRDRVWTFDRSTLTVVAGAASAVSEVPVPVEVVGGPYLVYPEAGTVVRLGAPPVVLDAGGPLGSPVRTPDGTVAVHRRDTGAVCGLHRDALELDCAISAPPGSRGGLTAVGGTVVFVDTGSDAAYRVLFGAGVDGGTRLGTDLPADALLGDRALGARLPVVLPGSNVLRLVDVGGLEVLRPGAAPVDVPLGEGAFSAPVVGESAIALLELTAGRLITFAPDGTRIGEVELPPGSTADDLVRGEDGRLYLDEPDGGRVHVVQPDGSVATVDIGDGTGPAVAVAPPPEQLAPVRPPPPGEVLLPAPDAPAVALGPAPDGPVLAAPGLPDPGGIAGAGDGPGAADGLGAGAGDGAGDGLGAPPPLVVAPPADVPPPPELPGEPPAEPPGEPPVGLPEEPPVEEVPEVPEAGVPGPPTGLTAQRRNAGGNLVIDVAWTPPTVGTAPVEYEVYTTGDARGGRATQAGTERRDEDNYCSVYTSYEVRSIGPTGAKSDPAVVVADAPDVDCTAEVEVISAEVSGSWVDVVAECSSPAGSLPTDSFLDLLVDGKAESFTGCEVPRGATDRWTFTYMDLEPGTTHTVQVRTSRTTGPTKFSNTVTVTIPG